MDHPHADAGVPTGAPDEFKRLPGLFRRWEIADVVELGADFHLEEAGDAADGTPLFAVYRRERGIPNPKEA